jgi:hypothetical protein
VDDLQRRRIERVLEGSAAPPKCPTKMTDQEIGDVLSVMASRGDILDGTTLWIHEAADRLMGRDGKG